MPDVDYPLTVVPNGRALELGDHTATVLIATLGGLGAALRFVVDGLIRSRFSTIFPAATVAIILTGLLLLGFCTGATVAGALTEHDFIAVGMELFGGASMVFVKPLVVLG